MLKAARQVFAEHGFDAPLELIARTAGVGRATQHRHFPTRESLVLAIFDDNIEALIDIVRESKPEEAFVRVLLETAEQVKSNRTFIELLDRRVARDVQEDITGRFFAVVAEPLERAKAAGVVRGDLRLEDTLLLIDMLGGAAHPPGPGRPDDRLERGIALVLDAIGAKIERRPLK